MYLLLKCVAERGGIWQPITGGVEDTDASILDAAYRELREETGITQKDILKVIQNVHYFEMNKPQLTGEPVTLKEHVFGFEIKPATKILLSKEHESLEWLPFNDAIGRLKWKDNKEAFEKLNKLLK